MTTEIKVGAKVSCPVTDTEGEVSFRIGKLTNINSRYATVECGDGEIIKVGKTKIELLEEPINEALTTAAKGRKSRHHYKECRAYSGRKSLDNGDKTALSLRGKELGEVYEIASEILEESVEVLMSKYSHLNPGQQRMCLGNRIRNT